MISSEGGCSSDTAPSLFVSVNKDFTYKLLIICIRYLTTSEIVNNFAQLNELNGEEVWKN